MSKIEHKPWWPPLKGEYSKRCIRPFQNSGIFLMSFLLLISVGFLGCWLTIVESYFKNGVHQDAINKAFCASVISLVIVSCVDVVLTLLRSDLKEHQKKIEIRDVTYVMSVGFIGAFIVVISLVIIWFPSSLWATIGTAVCVVSSILLWVQVNATNPVYFEEDKKMSSVNATPELPKSSKLSPYITKPSENK